MSEVQIEKTNTGNIFLIVCIFTSFIQDYLSIIVRQISYFFIFWIPSYIHENGEVSYDLDGNKFSHRVLFSVFMVLSNLSEAINSIKWLDTPQQRKLLLWNTSRPLIGYKVTKTQKVIRFSNIEKHKALRKLGGLMWINKTEKIGAFQRIPGQIMGQSHLVANYVWISGPFEGSVFQFPQTIKSIEDLKSRGVDNVVPSYYYKPSGFLLLIFEVAIAGWFLSFIWEHSETSFNQLKNFIETFK